MKKRNEIDRRKEEEKEEKEVLLNDKDETK